MAPSATEISHNGQDLGLIQQEHYSEKIEELTQYMF